MRGSRFGGWAPYGLAALLVAAMTNLVVILLVPSVATHGAYARLSEMGPVNATISLPQASPAERTLPFLDPAVAMSFCRFDLSAGPVRVAAPTGRAGYASLSVHTRLGAVAYALTDKAASHGKLEAVIVTASQLRALKAAEDEDNPSEDLRIVSATEKGYAILRVFSELPGLYPDAEAQAGQLSCRPEPTQ